MKRFLRDSSLQFLTPWHASVLNAKASSSKSNNGIKLIKPQYLDPINKNIEEKKKKIKLMIYFYLETFKLLFN